MLTIGCPQQVCAAGNSTSTPSRRQQVDDRPAGVGEHRVVDAGDHQRDAHAIHHAARGPRVERSRGVDAASETRVKVSVALPRLGAVPTTEPRPWLPVAAVAVTLLLWASAFVAIRHLGHDFSAGALSLGRLVVGVDRARAPWPSRAGCRGRAGATGSAWW